MSISVVIPLYNKGPYIARTLQSVLAQTVLPDEIIVVDDGSTDGGGEVVKQFTDPRIHLITQENRGNYGARNRGISEARGELIAFLDADDAWKPQYLEVIAELHRKYPEAGAYATAYEIVRGDGSLIVSEFDLPCSNADSGLITNYVKAALIKTDVIWTSALAIPSNVFKEVGGFPVSEVHSGDMDMWLRVGLRYPIAYSRKNLATYYKNATNRIFGFTLYRDEPAISQTARKMIKSGELSPEMIKDLQKYVSKYQMNAARDFLTLGKRSLALTMLRYSKENPMDRSLWWKWRLLAFLPGTITRLLWEMKQQVKKYKTRLVG